MSWQTIVTRTNGSSRNFLSSFKKEDQRLRIALPFFPANKKLMAKVEVQPPNSCFFSHCTSVLVFSFGFYTSNRFSDLSLFYFRKGQMKIRNFLFILFCRFVCFCCHYSLLSFTLSFPSQRILFNMILLYYISQRS